MNEIPNSTRKDKNFIQDTLADFQQQAAMRAGLSEDKVGQSVHRLKAALWKEIFQEDLNGFEYKDSAPFTYSRFWLETEEEARARGKFRENLIELWELYLREALVEFDLKKERQKELRRFMLVHAQSLIPPSIELELSANKPQRKARPESSADHNATADAGPSVESAGSSGPSFTLSPPRAGWTSALSLAAGAGAGALFPVAASALLAGASKITICTALGFAGFPIAGMAAGLATGIIMGGLKNHEAIGAKMDAVQGFAKVGAWMNGMKESVSFRQLAFNTIAGGLGGFGAGIALDLLGDSECVVDTFRAGTDALGLSDWAGMEALNAANEGLGDQVTGLTSQNAELNAQVDGLRTTLDGQVDIIDAQQDQIDTLNSRLDALESQSAAPTSLNVAHVTTAIDTGAVDSISCPSYISDCPDNGLLNVTDTINGVDTAEPAAVIANVTVPVEVLTEPQTVTVKSGDTLTSIVEKFYNVAEGSENFDKIMAEVANQNGLAGNQQNWLKVNWELTMPDVANANSLTGSLDRASLDSNWRAGNVTFSDVPKMAS